MHNSLKPTEEGIQILDALTKADGHILINALAGTGKTSMLQLMAPLSPQKPILYCVFNKDAAMDAESREWSCPILIKTHNSLGLRCWADAIGQPVNKITDPRKMINILGQVINDLHSDDKKEAMASYWEIFEAIGMAKNLGYVPDSLFPNARRLCDRETLSQRIESQLSDFAWEVVDNTLMVSIQTAYKGCIDYNDQIYMPALFGGSYPRFPHVLVDEDQDLSPCNIALLEKLVTGRLTAVGDRWQSIYGFRGAETNGVDKVKSLWSMEEMPLSVSHRCPKAIVEAAQWRVPHFQWKKDGGTYEKLQSLDPLDIPDGSAILCRNNAPLFGAAYSLLERGRSVSVAGSDIGPKIVRLLQKIGDPRDSQEDLLIKIEGWRQGKLLTTNAPATVNDQADCMVTFASWGENLGQAIAYAQDIFRKQGTITLSTGHKAKGREWDVVYHLDPWLLRDDDQDLNLRYVIQTRAKKEAYEINSKELQWE